MGAYAAIISVAASAVGAISDRRAKSKASAYQMEEARQAKRNAELNAQTIERENAIEESNLAQAHDKEAASNRARAAASGVTMDTQDSFALVMSDNATTRQRQRENLSESGRANAAQMRREGEAAYQRGKATSKATSSGGWGTLIKGASDIYDTGRSVDWWG